MGRLRHAARRLAGQRRVAAAASLCAALLAGVATASLVALPGADGTGSRDALQARAVDDLARFAAWLERNHAKGYIGEVGWPARTSAEGEAWNGVAEAWYDAADADRLWVTAWATGTWFGAEYPLAVYRTTPGGLAPGVQAEVVEHHPSTGGVLRGVVVAGGEFGSHAPGFSNTSPGTYGTDYRYDPPATFRFLASRGISLVRLPFRWERVQPRLGGELDPAEVGRIARTVAAAHESGLRVILDLHNFGEYLTPDGPASLGAEVDAATFADTWRRLAIAFRDVPGIVGYGLMNEPANVQPGGGLDAAQAWERISQAAVTAIRETGDRRVVLVGGYPWSGVHDWPARHPRAWIADPLGRVRYEAHQYWDEDRSGRYLRSYAEERAAAGRARVEREARTSRAS